MKKLALALIFALILTLVPAHAENSNITYIDIFSSDQGIVNGLAYRDGMLVATTDQNKYFAIDPFSDYRKTVRTLPSDWLDSEGYHLTGQWGVIPGDDGLYMAFYYFTMDDDDFAVSETTVILRRLTLSSGGKLEAAAEWELDFDDINDALDDYIINTSLSGACVVNGCLVGRIDDINRSYLAIFELDDGDCELLDSNASIHGIYRDGTVLISESDYASSGSEIIFSAFDPGTGDSEPLFTMPNESYGSGAYVAYSPEDDALFMVKENMLTRITGMDPDSAETICPVSTNISFMPLAVAPNRDTYITASGTFISQYDASRTVSGTTLTIHDRIGWYDAQETAQQAFSQLHPDVVIAQGGYSDIIQSMISQSSEIDIYILPSYTSDYDVLMERGYLTPLESIDGLSGYVARMYPFIQDFITRDGHIYALPVYFSAGTDYEYSHFAMDELGLTHDDIPATWLDLLRFMHEKPALFAENGVVSMFPLKRSISEVRSALFDGMMNDYMLHMASTGQTLTFDTPLMRSLLAEFEKVDFTALGLTEEGDAPGYTGYFKDTLFWNAGGNISPDQYNLPEGKALSPVILSLSEETEPMVRADIAVAVVNPYSKNKDLALEYIEQLMLNASQSYITAICPDANEPLLASDYDELLALRQENVAKYEAELAKAPEEEKEEWEELVATAREYLESTLNYEDDWCWEISEESITWYRSLDDYITISTSCGLNAEANQVIYTQFSQYKDGLITSDEMIKTIDERLRMMILEAQ